VSFCPQASVVTAKGATPTRVAYVLHGILGSGRNWRTLCRRLARQQPQTAFVLVDLRNHGASQGAPPPHTVTAAADDLVQLHAEHGPPDEILGHSFGGKVALRYAQRHPQGLERVWVLDSLAGAVPPSSDNDVLRVLQALRTVPQPLPSRDDLVSHLTGLGFSTTLGRWLTTNLKRTDSGYVWVFDLDNIDAMIADYWQLDLWPVLRQAPMPIEVVRAGKSDRWDQQVLDRFTTQAGPHVRLHVLPDAGHWVHVDDPQGLVQLITEVEG